MTSFSSTDFHKALNRCKFVSGASGSNPQVSGAAYAVAPGVSMVGECSSFLWEV